MYCSQFRTSVIHPLPGSQSPRHALFLCLFQPNLISKLRDLLCIPPLREDSPPLPAWSHIWVSLLLRVQSWTGGGVLRVVKEVWMCVRADLYLPHVWEQETSCLLSCLSPVLFMLLLIPGSLLIAKTEEHFFNTLSDVFTSPERARTANANILVKKTPKDFLGLFHPAISQRKQAG